MDALIEDNTRLQRELAMARADSERLRLELVAANTTPETGAGNVMVGWRARVEIMHTVSVSRQAKGRKYIVTVSRQAKGRKYTVVV